MKRYNHRCMGKVYPGRQDIFHLKKINFMSKFCKWLSYLILHRKTLITRKCTNKVFLNPAQKYNMLIVK